MFYDILKPNDGYEEVVYIAESDCLYNIKEAIKTEYSWVDNIKIGKFKYFCMPNMPLLAFVIFAYIVIFNPFISLLYVLMSPTVCIFGNLELYYFFIFISIFYNKKTKFKTIDYDISLHDVLNNKKLLKKITTNYSSIITLKNGRQIINLCNTDSLDNLDKECVYLVITQSHNEFDTASSLIRLYDVKNGTKSINTGSHISFLFYNKLHQRWEFLGYEGFMRRECAITKLENNKTTFYYIAPIQLTRHITMDEQTKIFGAYTDFTDNMQKETKMYFNVITWAGHGTIRSLRSFEFVITKDMPFYTKFYRRFCNNVFDMLGNIVEYTGIEPKNKKFCSESFVEKLKQLDGAGLLSKKISINLHKELHTDNEITPRDIILFHLTFIADFPEFVKSFKVLIK